MLGMAAGARAGAGAPLRKTLLQKWHSTLESALPLILADYTRAYQTRVEYYHPNTYKDVPFSDSMSLSTSRTPDLASHMLSQWKKPPPGAAESMFAAPRIASVGSLLPVDLDALAVDGLCRTYQLLYSWGIRYDVPMLMIVHQLSKTVGKYKRGTHKRPCTRQEYELAKTICGEWNDYMNLLSNDPANYRRMKWVTQHELGEMDRITLRTVADNSFWRTVDRAQFASGKTCLPHLGLTPGSTTRAVHDFVHKYWTEQQSKQLIECAPGSELCDTFLTLYKTMASDAVNCTETYVLHQLIAEIERVSGMAAESESQMPDGTAFVDRVSLPDAVTRAKVDFQQAFPREMVHLFGSIIPMALERDLQTLLRHPDIARHMRRMSEGAKRHADSSSAASTAESDEDEFMEDAHNRSAPDEEKSAHAGTAGDDGDDDDEETAYLDNWMNQTSSFGAFAPDAKTRGPAATSVSELLRSSLWSSALGAAVAGAAGSRLAAGTAAAADTASIIETRWNDLEQQHKTVMMQLLQLHLQKQIAPLIVRWHLAHTKLLRHLTMFLAESKQPTRVEAAQRMRDAIQLLRTMQSNVTHAKLAEYQARDFEHTMNTRIQTLRTDRDRLWRMRANLLRDLLVLHVYESQLTHRRDQLAQMTPQSRAVASATSGLPGGESIVRVLPVGVVGMPESLPMHTFQRVCIRGALRYMHRTLVQWQRGEQSLCRSFTSTPDFAESVKWLTNMSTHYNNIRTTLHGVCRDGIMCSHVTYLRAPPHAQAQSARSPSASPTAHGSQGSDSSSGSTSSSSESDDSDRASPVHARHTRRGSIQDSDMEDARSIDSRSSSSSSISSRGSSSGYSSSSSSSSAGQRTIGSRQREPSVRSTSAVRPPRLIVGRENYYLLYHWDETTRILGSRFTCEPRTVRSILLSLLSNTPDRFRKIDTDVLFSQIKLTPRENDGVAALLGIIQRRTSAMNQVNAWMEANHWMVPEWVSMCMGIFTGLQVDTPVSIDRLLYWIVHATLLISWFDVMKCTS